MDNDPSDEPGKLVSVSDQANNAMNQLLRRGRGRLSIETTEGDNAAGSEMNAALRAASGRHTIAAGQDPAHADLNARIRDAALNGGRQRPSPNDETPLAAAVRRAEEARRLGDPAVIAAAEAALDIAVENVRHATAVPDPNDINARIRAAVSRRRVRFDI